MPTEPYYDLKPATRWLRTYFEELDVWHLFEVDEDREILRQIELWGRDTRKPITAAAVAEWQNPNTDEGRRANVRSSEVYGMSGEKGLPPDGEDDFRPEHITQEEFEATWRDARAALEAAAARGEPRDEQY